MYVYSQVYSSVIKIIKIFNNYFRIAYKTDFSSLVLVTDAICAMGFQVMNVQIQKNEQVTLQYMVNNTIFKSN